MKITTTLTTAMAVTTMMIRLATTDPKGKEGTYLIKVYCYGCLRI